MSQEIHRKNKNNRAGNTGKHAATGISDAQWRGDTYDHQTSPGQREAIMQMSSKRRQQCYWEIGVEMEILTQFRKTEIFCADIGAAQSKRRFCPVLDFERRQHLLVGDVPSIVVMDDFYFLKTPGLGVGIINGARCQVILDDIVVGVLLQDLDIIEQIVTGPKTLDEPGPEICPIPENLALNAELM